MPKNPRRVAFNFQKRSKRRESRPNVFSGAVPAAGATEGRSAQSSDQPAAVASSPRPVRRPGGRGRARSVVYTEYLRQELLKFGAVTVVMVVAVVVAAILYR